VFRKLNVSTTDQTQFVFQNKTRSILDFLNERLLGKQQTVMLSLACVIARGHLLLEDVPGVGKTTLAKSLAEVFGLQLTRIQFTSDLLPADILGGSVFNAQSNQFVTRKGPIFSEFVLADELNRGSPRTQSAVLEAMEERKVTLEGETFSLPDPFLFVATQNPHFQSGTNPLPESQLDRFLMTLNLGFPAAAAERELIRRGRSSHRPQEQTIPTATKQDLQGIQAEVEQVFLSEGIIDYIQNIINKTRSGVYDGVSPRGAIALALAAKAIAYLSERHFVIPEDVQTAAIPVLAHRWSRADQDLSTNNEKIRELLQQTEIP
jgi:MoxR-like ATPase